MPNLKIFVSHSHDDNLFCRFLVTSLIDAGADVWYDEHNLDSGQLMEVVQRELETRHVFIVILSKSAFASQWVRRETTWAYRLLDRDPTRILLPVTAKPIDGTDFSGRNGWLFLEDFKRIEAPNYQAYSQEETVRRTLHALLLTPKGEKAIAPNPLAGESFEDLMTQGKSLAAQLRYREALPFFEQALKISPNAEDAMSNLSLSLCMLGDYVRTLYLSEKILAANPRLIFALINKGIALRYLHRNDEALQAYNQVLSIEPDNVTALADSAIALIALHRNGEALSIIDRALLLEPDKTETLRLKATILEELGDYSKALEVCNRAIKLDPNFVLAWNKKGRLLLKLGRIADALEAFERAINIAPQFPMLWSNKAEMLWLLGRSNEALQAWDKAISLDSRISIPWYYKQVIKVDPRLYRRASDVITRVLQDSLNPSPFSAESWYLVAQCLNQLGLTSQAQEAEKIADSLR